MNGTLVATTPRNAMHALAFQGITVCQFHAQLCQMLRNSLGDKYVLLFAEPVPGAANGDIDWYTPVQGTVSRLRDLPEDGRAHVEEKLAVMGAAMQRLADELKQSPDALRATRGHVLELALRYPGPDAIYLVGGQPVLTCWGFGPGTPGVEPQSLSRPAQAPGRRDAQAAAAPPAGRRGLCWWLLPGALLLLLLFVLFTSFGGLEPLGGRALWRVPLPAFLGDAGELAKSHARAEEAAALELAELRRRAQEHAAACKRGAPRPGRDESGRESLDIPENADNAGFMSGRWLCTTGLGNKSTRQPVQFEFSFGQDGAGMGIVHEKDDTCEGSARAALTGGVLRVELEPQTCRRSGAVYTPLKIECRKSEGRETVCRGTNQDGSSWDAAFSRIR